MNSGPTRSRMQSERGYGRSPSMQCGLAAQDLSDRIQLIGMSRRPIALYLACEAIVAAGPQPSAAPDSSARKNSALGSIAFDRRHKRIIGVPGCAAAEEGCAIGSV